MLPFLDKLKPLVSPLSIIAVFIVGMIFPQGHCLKFLTRYLIMTMLFLSCLPLALNTLQPRWSHARLCVANLVIGLAPWALLHYCFNADDWAKICFYTGIAPSAVSSPVIVGFLGGNVAYALTAFLIDSIFIALALTGLIPLVQGNFSLMAIGDVGFTLFVVVGVPMLLSRIIRRWTPGLTRKITQSPLTKKFSFVLWLIVLYVIAATAADFLGKTDLEAEKLALIAVISLLLCVSGFAVGYWLGEKGLRRESSQCLGQKNNTLALYIALTFGDPFVALGPTFYTFWHNVWNAAQLYLATRRRSGQE
jgi:BASS family bile acid:Na+ symporter